MTVTATLGTLTFSSDPAVSNLSIQDQDGLDGWFSGPPAKTAPDDRANGDGYFGVAQVYRSGRPIVLSGLFVGTGDPVADALTWRKLAAVFPSGTPQTLTVTDPAGSLSSSVILAAGACHVSPLVAGMATFSIAMIAPDPIRYGTVSNPSAGLPTSGGGLGYNLGDPADGTGTLNYGANGNLGRVALTNNGTANVFPQFTVTGQLDAGFYLQNLDTGQVLRYDRVVPLGSAVSINSATGEVLVDGVSDASTYMTRSEFFSVPAGGTTTVQFNSISTTSGTPTMTATIQDGWW